MRILIIEDDEDKRRHIAAIVRENVDEAQLYEARSFSSGLKAITDHVYDLVILDMTMPTFDVGSYEDGGRPQAFGGRELLLHMKRRQLKTAVIVVTQFDRFGEGAAVMTLDELNEELASQYGDNYLGAIHYDVAYADWKDRLGELLQQPH